MENIQHLLERVADINKKNNEILDATGGRFNMFRICGVNHDENKHSAIIAEFLDPTGSHGLKSKLLECFIETLGNDFTVKDFHCEKAKIRTEQPTNDGRIDIFIEDNQGKAIIIENKIYAGDQPEQLKRYDDYVKKHGKDYQIFYLTLFGAEASKQSCEGVNYLPISYKDNIINWLEKCVAIAVHFPMVRETINQYINHLKYLTDQDMDTKNNKEIVEMIVRDQKLLESAEYIAINAWEDCKKKIISNFEEEIKKTAEVLELIVDIPSSFNVKGGTISLYKNEWNFCIRYYVEDKNFTLLIGIAHRDNDNKCTKEMVTKLREKCSQFNKFNLENWIVVSYFDEWNSSSWAEAQKNTHKIVFDKTKAILDVLEKNGF